MKRGREMPWERKIRQQNQMLEAESQGRVADSLEVRGELIRKLHASEMTLEQIQAELKRIKRNAKKNGKITRTQAEIDTAFKIKAMRYHPDNQQTGDPALFKQFSDWRLAAKAWVTGAHNHAHEYVMAIDQYKEARLNLKALQMAFFYIRRLEDVGAPAILSQTLGAFRAKLTGGSSGNIASVA